MKLVIERKRWLRGETSGKSALLRSTDQKMCCLGFYCLALGLDRQEMIDHATPVLEQEDCSMIQSAGGGWMYDLRPDGSMIDLSTDCRYLMTENDTNVVGDDERERLIAERFKKHDVEVEFVD